MTENTTTAATAATQPEAHEIWAAAQLAPGEGIEDGVARIAALIAPAAQEAEPAIHPDDRAVDRFAAAMKSKLAAARAKGRGGWETNECTQDRLSQMLREHVEKGDPRDVANFCTFLWNRGESIATSAPRPEADAGAPDPWREHLAEQADRIDCKALQRAMAKFGCSTPEGGMDHFRASLGTLVNLFVQAAAEAADSVLAARAAQEAEPAWLAEVTGRLQSLAALKKRSDSMPVMHEIQWLTSLRNRMVAAPRPQADAGAVSEGWLQMRNSLAMFLLGWAERKPEDQSVDKANRALDAITEPGLPLAILRSAPDWRAAAPQAPAAAVAPAGAVERIVHLRANRARCIYVAGPMTGLPEYNFPAFNAATDKLRAEGWHVENPAEHGHVKGAGWADYLRWDISRITTCGAIYLLPGWSSSKGANLEVHIAGVLGLQVILADGAEPVAAAPQPPAAAVAPAVVPVAREYPCSACCGTGADGDVGQDGRVTDVACNGCGGSGKTSARVELPWPWKTETEVLHEAINHIQGQERLKNALRIIAAAAVAPAAAPTQEADGWMPIETAPRDGTEIDLFNRDGHREAGAFWGLPPHECGEMGRYCDSEWHGYEPGWVTDFWGEPQPDSHFTHWRRPPAPPAARTRQEGAQHER